MSDRENQIEVQAWVDGELNAIDSPQVADRVARDPQLRALADNLRDFQEMLRTHEAPRPVPETRDFYWSKIRLRIEHEEAVSRRTTPVRTPPFFLRMAWLLPLGATALAAFLFLRPNDGVPQPAVSPNVAIMVGHEIETPSAAVEAVTFYSTQDAMTVVWLARADVL